MCDLVVEMLILKEGRCNSFRKLKICCFFNNFDFLFSDTKMKVIMPYVTWRVVGKSSRRKKQKGKHETIHWCRHVLKILLLFWLHHWEQGLWPIQLLILILLTCCEALDKFLSLFVLFSYL